MKIVNIILDGRIAGPQLRIAETAVVLKRDFNLDTLVVLPRRDSREFRQILDNYGLSYRTSSLHHLTKVPSRFLAWMFLFIPELIKLKKILKSENPDVVHCSGSWQWKGILAAKLAKKKVIWHLNDTYMPAPVRFVFRLLKKRANGFIVEGGRVKDYYLGQIELPGPVMEMQSPVDTRRFDPAVVEPARDFGTPGKRKIITLGNVNPCKGLEYFLEAAAILSSHFPELEFFVVGGLYRSQKNYIGRLKEMIRLHGLDNVYFYGYTLHVAPLLQAAHIYVCSSVTEASPTSVWEAMSMAKPIVATAVGSVDQFIAPGESGFVVPIKDARALAREIEVFLLDPALQQKCGENARQIAVEELDIRISAQKHKEIYEKINNG